MFTIRHSEFISESLLVNRTILLLRKRQMLKQVQHDSKGKRKKQQRDYNGKSRIVI